MDELYDVCITLPLERHARIYFFAGRVYLGVIRAGWAAFRAWPS